MVTVEICVDSVAGLQAAIEGGAHRVELCSALELGGLTPTPGLIEAARHVPVPVMAMIRPRAGDFVFSEDEIALIRDEIASIRAAGLAGVVIGASKPDGALDRDALARLVQAAEGLDLTLHRAVDLAPDASAAVEMAAELGIGRILSSGGAARAEDGLDRLADMVAASAGRVSIMAGSGVTDTNAAAILERLGTREIHGSCSQPVEQAARAQELGFSEPFRRVTSAESVARLVSSVLAPHRRTS